LLRALTIEAVSFFLHPFSPFMDWGEKNKKRFSEERGLSRFFSGLKRPKPV